MTPVSYIGLILAMFINVRSGAQNLVLNGGAELFDSTTMIPHDWTIVSGNPVSQLPGAGHADSSHSGGYDFFAGTNALGVLQQDVDVTSFSTEIDASVRRFYFTGFVQSFPQSVLDSTAIVVQCLNAAKTSILYAFGDTTASVSNWAEVSNTFVAPAGTRYVRIQLIGVRNTGFDNDAYFDDISLTTNTLAVPETPGSAGVSVAPNPAHGSFTVRLLRGETATITLADLVGRTMLRVDGVKNTAQFSTETLAPGVYIVRIATGEREVVQRLIVD